MLASYEASILDWNSRGRLSLQGCVVICQVAHLVEHIFDEDAIPRGGVVDQNVSNSSNELAVLNDGRAAQVCGQVRTTNFVIFFIKFLAASSSSSLGNRLGKVFFMLRASYFEPA